MFSFQADCKKVEKLNLVWSNPTPLGRAHGNSIPIGGLNVISKGDDSQRDRQEQKISSKHLRRVSSE